MYGGDKSCITNRFLQGATTPNGLWEPVLGKGDGRRHFVGGYGMQGGHLGADVPLLSHAPLAWTSSLGRVRLFHRKNSAGRCQRPTCHSLSPRVIATHFFFHTGERGNKYKLWIPQNGNTIEMFSWQFSSSAVHFLTLEQELIAVNSSAPQSQWPAREGQCSCEGSCLGRGCLR